MGYEIKLYIGQTDGKPSSLDNGHAWLDVFAMVDICKPGYDSAIFRLTGRKGTGKERTETLVYFYTEDGNTRVQQDRYGDKLRAYPIADVIDAVSVDASNDRHRRFKWALELLKTIHADAPNAVVTLYGY